jgi:hypothetical protein
MRMPRSVFWLLAFVCPLLPLLDQGAMAGGMPAFSVVAPNGAKNILIGTIHIPYPGLVQPSPAVLDGYGRLVVEHLNLVHTAASPVFPVTEHPIVESAGLDANELKTLEDRLN